MQSFEYDNIKERKDKSFYKPTKKIGKWNDLKIELGCLYKILTGQQSMNARLECTCT